MTGGEYKVVISNTLGSKEKWEIEGLRELQETQ